MEVAHKHKTDTVGHQATFCSIILKEVQNIFLEVTMPKGRVESKEQA